jgi:hypothetical protein
MYRRLARDRPRLRQDWYSLFRARNGKVALARTPALHAVALVGALTAHLFRPRTRSVTTAQRRRFATSPQTSQTRKHRSFAEGSANASDRPVAALPDEPRYGRNFSESGRRRYGQMRKAASIRDQATD